MIFKNPEYLYFILCLPLLFYIFFLRLKWSEIKIKKYFNLKCLKAVRSPVSRKAGFAVFLIFSLFVILALARPQRVKEGEEIKIQGAEVMILADVSDSMKVKDMAPLDRRSAMKKDLKRLIELLAGSRVGLIAFAGSALLLSPLTVDHKALNIFLDSLPRAYIQGTHFGSALRLARQALLRGGAGASSASVIVIASDGEDNEEEALEEAKRLGKEGVRIFTLGFGTSQGGFIPVYDKRGNKKQYKKDKKGQLVVSRFNEKGLKNLARVSGGAFYTSSLGAGAVNKVYKDIQSAGEGKFSYISAHKHKEEYSWFVLTALIFGFALLLSPVFAGAKSAKKTWRSYLEKQE